MEKLQRCYLDLFSSTEDIIESIKQQGAVKYNIANIPYPWETRNIIKKLIRKTEYAQRQLAFDLAHGLIDQNKMQKNTIIIAVMLIYLNKRAAALKEIYE